MSHDAENLLEVDRIDEVLDGADPPPPVVVIQYSKKGLSSFWVMALIVVIPIGGILIYHHREVKRLESQTRAARRDLESWKERFHIETVQEELVPAARGIVPSSSPGLVAPIPVAKASADAHTASALGPGTGKESPVDVGTSAGRPPSVEGRIDRAATSTLTRESSTVAAWAGDLAPSPTVLGSTSPPKGVLSPFDGPPQATVEPAGLPLEAVAVRTPSVAQPLPAASPALTDVPDALAQPSRKAPESDAAASAAPPSTPVAVLTEPPLPSKEETLRMIEEEAVQKQEEIRRQVQDKAGEIHRMRYEERFRFHQDLREALEKNGRQAGPVISQLCVRYGYEADHRRVFQGKQFWFGLTRSFAYRARWVREKLDLPETAILNYISDGLHERLHTPNGPRDGNEVRVRAAKILLSCSLLEPGESNRMTAIDPRSTPSATRRTANPSSRAADVARPR